MKSRKSKIQLKNATLTTELLFDIYSGLGYCFPGPKQSKTSSVRLVYVTILSYVQRYQSHSKFAYLPNWKEVASPPPLVERHALASLIEA